MTSEKGKILVVDDDPHLLRMLVDTLTGIGYRTVAASDGIEALDLLRRDEAGTFDLMITDIKMPNMDGIGLLKRARRYHPELPVLFITGVASEDIIGEASPDGFLAKPFRISRLEELIENALLARRTGRIHHPQQPRRVLVNVTEDEFRQTLAEALTFGKFLPFAVNGDEEALEELERGEFDVMITGIEKGLSGSQATVNRVRERYPSLPMLAVSSSYSSEEASELECLPHLDGFVQKPFSVARLFEMLDDAIAQHPAGEN